MVVGVAVSDIVDPKDKRMTFSAEELEGSDGIRYRNLTNIMDDIGSINDLSNERTSECAPEEPQMKHPKPKPDPKSKPASESQILSTAEVDDNSSDEDLPMYEKPDSDAEDSEDDPTLIQRDKPSAPV